MGVESHSLYRHFDADGKLLYVGVSLSSVKRLMEHRSSSHWFPDISTVTIEKFPSREEVLQAERRAILEENPIHNIKRPSHKDIKRGERERNSHESSAELTRRITKFNPLYSVGDVAGLFGIGQQAVRQLIADDKLGSIKVGMRQKVTGWQLISYLEHLESTGYVR